MADEKIKVTLASNVKRGGKTIKAGTTLELPAGEASDLLAAGPGVAETPDAIAARKAEAGEAASAPVKSKAKAK